MTYIEKLKQFEKDKKELQARKRFEYLQRQERYSGTRAGRISSLMKSGIKMSRRGIARTLYRRNYTPPLRAERKITPAELKRIRLQIAQLRMQRMMQRPVYNPQQQIEIQRRIAEQNYYNWIFNGGDMMPSIVEREVHSSGGHTTVGDRVAMFNISNETMHHANVLNNPYMNPLRSVEIESNLHASLQHINPIASIDRETFLYSNLVF